MSAPELSAEERRVVDRIEQAPDALGLREEVAAVIGAHRYRDVLGDYEVAPYYKHFGCTCGWEQNIAGMSGWRSWIAAHNAHVADALLPLIERHEAEAAERALRDAASEVAMSACDGSNSSCDDVKAGAPCPYDDAARIIRVRADQIGRTR